MYLKILFFATLLAFVAFRSVTSLSPEQMEKLARNMRKSCLEKIDTTEEKVDGLRIGEFPDDENLACYTHCIMKTLRTFKNGAIDFPMVAKQVEMAWPPDVAKRVKESMAKCEREYTGDPCEISYSYTKCCYEADPEVFVFP